jgi:annexin A7/11
MGDIDKDVETLKKSLKIGGAEKVDENAIIKLLANRNNVMRQQLRNYYNQKFNRDLVSDLKAELDGKFEAAIVALLDDPFIYDAKSLHKAMKGVGTDTDACIEIICTRPNWYLKNIMTAYTNLTGGDLIKDLKSEVKLMGNTGTLLCTLLQCQRSENPTPNKETIEKYADDLIKGGIQKLGTDEKLFMDILTKTSTPELQLLIDTYQKKAGESLLVSIDKEFTGDVKKTLKTIIYANTTPSEYFAQRVNEAITSGGQKDELLMRILITRDEVDMPKIKECYKTLYGKDMVESIKEATLGDYKNLLVELCDH